MIQQRRLSGAEEASYNSSGDSSIRTGENQILVDILFGVGREGSAEGEAGSRRRGGKK